MGKCQRTHRWADRRQSRSRRKMHRDVSGLPAGLIAGNLDLVGKCIEDVIVEPARARLIRGFGDVKTAALKAGAFGCSISGSGPSIFAVAPSMRAAKKIGLAMASAFRRSAHVRSEVY